MGFEKNSLLNNRALCKKTTFTSLLNVTPPENTRKPIVIQKNKKGKSGRNGLSKINDLSTYQGNLPTV